jgi:hypothetical protein
MTEADFGIGSFVARNPAEAFGTLEVNLKDLDQRLRAVDPPGLDRDDESV